MEDHGGSWRGVEDRRGSGWKLENGGRVGGGGGVFAPPRLRLGSDKIITPPLSDFSESQIEFRRFFQIRKINPKSEFSPRFLKSSQTWNFPKDCDSLVRSVGANENPRSVTKRNGGLRRVALPHGEVGLVQKGQTGAGLLGSGFAVGAAALAVGAAGTAGGAVTPNLGLRVYLRLGLTVGAVAVGAGVGSGSGLT